MWFNADRGNPASTPHPHHAPNLHQRPHAAHADPEHAAHAIHGAEPSDVIHAKNVVAASSWVAASTFRVWSVIVGMLVLAVLALYIAYPMTTALQFSQISGKQDKIACPNENVTFPAWVSTDGNGCTALGPSSPPNITQYEPIIAYTNTSSPLARVAAPQYPLESVTTPTEYRLQLANQGIGGVVVFPTLTLHPSGIVLNATNGTLPTIAGNYPVVVFNNTVSLTNQGVGGLFVNPTIQFDNSGVALFVSNGSFPSFSGVFPVNVVNSTIFLTNQGVGGFFINPILTLDSTGIVLFASNGTSLSALYPLQINGSVIAMAGSLPSTTITRPGTTVIVSGVITSIVEAPPIQASDVQFGNTTVDVVLNAPFVTTGTSLAPNAHVIQNGYGTLATVGTGFVQIDLTNTGVTAGFFDYAGVTVGLDGRLTAVTANPTPTASNVFTNTGGSIQNALNSNFMMVNPAVDIPGGYTFNPDFDIFIWQLSNNTYDFTVRPRPLINVTCTHPMQLQYDAFGFPQVCIQGIPPGQPGGPATLDGSGKVPIDQLPAFLFQLILYGTWNAFNNTPFLTNATCTSNSSFYYIVADGGNTTLGSHSYWLEGDWAVCINGTWDQIRSAVHVDVSSFNGRTGVVIPQLGDYPANLIDMGGGYTLDVLAGYGFVMWTASPGLSNGQLLQGTIGNIIVSGTIIDLATIGSMPLPDNFFAGFACDVHVDHHGRVTAVGTCNPLLNLYAGSNIILTGTQNITISVNPNLLVTSVNASSFLGIGSETILAAGSGTVTIPSHVSATFFALLDVDQVFSGINRFVQAVRIGSSSIYVALDHAPGATNATNFYFPIAEGTTGQYLVSLGGGEHGYVAPPTMASVLAGINIAVSGGPAYTVSTVLNPAFVNATIGGTAIVGSGSGTITLPALTGTVALLENAQTFSGQKSFSVSPALLSDVGLTLNNAGNTFSTVLCAGSLTSNIPIRLPATNGTAGQCVVTDGAGNWAYASNGVTTIGANGPITVNATSGVVQVGISATPTFTTVTATTSMTIDGVTLLGSGGGVTATFPALTGTVALLENAQTFSGVKSFTASPVLRTDVGLTLNNAANTFSTILRAGTSLASNLVVRLPITNGANGNSLITDGAGNTRWGVASSLTFRQTSTRSASTGATFVTLLGSGLGIVSISGNTLSAGSVITIRVQGAASNSGGNVQYRIALNANTITITASNNNGVNYGFMADVDMTVRAIGVSGTICAGGLVVRGTPNIEAASFIPACFTIDTTATITPDLRIASTGGTVTFSSTTATIRIE